MEFNGVSAIFLVYYLLWIQYFENSKNSSDSKIGLGLRPCPILLSSEFFSSNYFQIGQHVVLLHILMYHRAVIFLTEVQQK